MPPALIVAGNVIQGVVKTTLNGQTLLNVLHWRVVNAPSATTYVGQLGQIFSAINAAGTGLIALMRAGMTSQATILDFQTQRIYPTRSPYLRSTINQDGLVAIDPAPQNVCISITKQATISGRGKSGHFQLGGLPVDRILGGIWNSDAIDNANDIGDWIEAGVSYGGMVTDLISIMAPAGPGATLDDVYGCFAHPEIRTMHRRTVGLGI